MIDLHGQTFGHLSVIEIFDIPKQGVRWLCRCSCGKLRRVRGSKLTSGKTHSCGACSGWKHGHGGGSKEYSAWKAMKARCYNPNVKHFDCHGGRGIRVCREWRNDFTAFLAYVGPAPGPEYSLDRYPDNDGNYEPGNVRWATSKQQNNNRRPRRWGKRPDGDDE